MKQKLIPLFFAFLAALAVKAGGIEIDSIRHPLIIDGRTDATLVKPSEGHVPSRKATPSKIARQNTGNENFNLVTTGTFKCTFFQNSSGAPYSYTAALRQSDKNPNRFLITPFIDNDEGMIVEITHKKNDAGAYILKVTPAATGYEHPSYGMVNAREGESSSFDGTTFRLNLSYYVNAGSFGGVYNETFEIPAGLVTYTEEPNDGILYYSITNADSREVSVVGMKDTERTTVDIPESVDLNGDTYSVTGIGDEAFQDCSDLVSVTIPNSVQSIGESAFSDCKNIAEITIPNSVTAIEPYTFMGCTSLASVVIPNSVMSIGDGAFSNCKALTSFNFPNALTSIGQSAFAYCEGLTGDLVLPNSLTFVGYVAFWYCNGITSIFIPASVTTIERNDGQTFSSTNLESINVDEGNTVYDSREGCNAIIETASNTLIRGCKNTIIPNTVTSIGFCAFINSLELKEIAIPSSVTSIGSRAFRGCPSLLDVYVSRTDPAEYNCSEAAFETTSTATLHVPTGTSEAYASLAPWSSFRTIVDEEGHTIQNLMEDGDNWTDGVLTYSITDASNHEVSVIGLKDTERTTIDIPESVDINGETYSVTSIGGYAFDYCKALTSVTIPNSVTSIGEGAFELCSNLTSVIIPNSVTSIGEGAFSGCTSLTSITIPESVTSIGEYAFSGCKSMTSITIPESVTSIGEYAFRFCPGLTSIQVDKDNTVYDSRENCNAIIETASNTLVAGCMNTVIPGSVTSIANWAFSYCAGLTSITIPESVTNIGENAFFNCTSLTSIVIPNSVTSIGEGAFGYCKSMTSITVDKNNTVYDSRENCNAIIETASNTLVAGCMNTVIPGSVTSIGRMAFYYCLGLTSIDIPNSVTSIGESAFQCTSLTSIVLPNSVTTIGESAFQYCTSLTSIDIPNSVTTIGESAFNECTSLTSIVIPNSVTSIGEQAFVFCSGLTSITIPESVTSIGEFAFYYCTGLKDVYALRTSPAEYGAAESCFYGVPTSTCTLHVPAGCKDAYASLAPWSAFENIVEFDPTAINQLEHNAEKNVSESFNLQGQRISVPQHGVNIIRYSDGTSKKILVK